VVEVVKVWICEEICQCHTIQLSIGQGTYDVGFEPVQILNVKFIVFSFLTSVVALRDDNRFLRNLYLVKYIYVSFKDI